MSGAQLASEGPLGLPHPEELPAGCGELAGQAGGNRMVAKFKTLGRQQRGRGLKLKEDQTADSRQSPPRPCLSPSSPGRAHAGGHGRGRG